MHEAAVKERLSGAHVIASWLTSDAARSACNRLQRSQHGGWGPVLVTVSLAVCGTLAVGSRPLSARRVVV
eukprot:scaffold18772_cov112-Isochrysis_galbana.AAC.10